MREKFSVGDRYGRILTTVLFSAIAVLTGCQTSAPATAPVKGKVTLNGQPLTSGNVLTLPASGHGANGSIAADGSFELRTFAKNDGALVGTHKVAVVVFSSTGKSDPEASVGKLIVPDRYINPETSNLSIEVKAGETNTPTLELTSP